MIKKTLYIGNPCNLSLRNEQMCITNVAGIEKTIPSEDIGLIVLDHAQSRVTIPLLSKLSSLNVAVMVCNEKHMPQGMLLNLEGHTLQSARFKAQVAASLPLQKNLWQQTVKAKIQNQAAVCEQIGVPSAKLYELADKVKSGDPDNLEAQAAQYYFRRVFSTDNSFRRIPEGDFPNNLLNYGYAIIRALVARALTGTGLHPTLGISHQNQYNPYCLADDIMEPYRPFVDLAILEYIPNRNQNPELSKEDKVELLNIPVRDTVIDGKKSPLMNATQRTAASLVACYQGEIRKLLYPEI